MKLHNDLSVSPQVMIGHTTRKNLEHDAPKGVDITCSCHLGKLIVFVDPRLRPLKFLDNAGEAEITKTDFAVRVNQYVRLVTRAMSQLQDNTTRPCKVAMNNGTLVQVRQPIGHLVNQS